MNTLETTTKNRNRLLLTGVCIAAFAVMLFLNVHTPLMQDDYDYSFSWATGQPLRSIGDVFASQMVHYRLWGGRSVTHSIVQLFLLAGKPVFNVFNALAFLLLLIEIVTLSGKSPENFKWDIPVAMFFLFCLSYFGWVFLWLDGACNYLWGSLLALLPLFIWKKREQDGSLSKGAAIISMLILFLSGWTNENSACGIFLTQVIVLFLGHLRKKRRVSFLDIIMLLFQLAGILFLLLAPGNFVRASVHSFSLMELAMRPVRILYYYIRFDWPAILLWVFACASSVMRGTFSIWDRKLLLASLLSALALAVSPEVSDRSFLICYVLLLADALSMLTLGKKGRMIMTSVLSLALFVMAIGAGTAVLRHESRWQAELHKIEEAAARGDEEVTITSVPSASRYTMPILLEKRFDEWPNSTLSKWFGIRINGEPAAE